MIDQYQKEKNEVKGIYGMIDFHRQWSDKFQEVTVHDYNQYKEIRNFGFQCKPMSDVWKGTYLHESLEEYFKGEYQRSLQPRTNLYIGIDHIEEVQKFLNDFVIVQKKRTKK